MCGLALAASLYFAHAQTITDTTGQPVMADPNEDVSNLSDLEVELKALELATPLAASNVPSAGNFYSAQHAPGSAEEWPPLPANMFNLPVWPLDTNIFIIDDLNFNYGGDSAKVLKGSSGTVSETLVRADDEGPPTPPGGGGGDTNLPPTPHIIPQDYGTNLWIAQWGIVSNSLTAIASNSLADVEYEIQTNSDLTTTNWAGTGQFFLGSEATNWTQFILPPSLATNNLFFRLQSWASGDGSGIPAWWESKYFGTNAVDPYADPTGDGYTVLEDFQNGWNPNVPQAPPAPQLTVSYNYFSNLASLSWTAVLTPATSYTVERFEVFQTFVQSNVFNLSGNVNSMREIVPNADAYVAIWGPGGAPTAGVYYQIQAHYAVGDSAWSPPVYVQPNVPASVTLVAGPQGLAYLAVASVPSGTTDLRLWRLDPAAENNGDYSFNTHVDIALSTSTNGLYPLPTSITTSPTDAYGQSTYQWYLELVNETGTTNFPAILDDSFGDSAGNFGIVPPFVDGRVQLKQNLAFLPRARLPDTAFQFEVPEQGAVYTNPPNYAYAGFTQTPIAETYNSTGNFDPLVPFEDNYLYRNFVYNLSDVDGNGRMTTGIGDIPYEDQLTLGLSPTYQFQGSMISGTSAPALLATNEPEWLASYPLDGNGSEIGVAAGSSTYYTMTNDVQNIFGLQYLGVQLVWGNSIGDSVPLPAGNTIQAGSISYLYPDVVQPQFQMVEYDFWPGTIANPNAVDVYATALPGNPAFSPTNTSQLVIGTVGSLLQVFGYAKLAIQNGNPGVYGYLGQYFDQAFQIGTNGVVTTNTTGVLSPYGSFFATQPGPIALTTMPDPDTGEQGTCTVYCVSMNVDKNHDGIMDLSFNGPDATSQMSPMQFWINSDNDWSYYLGDPGVDVNTTMENADYNNQNIPSQRDLEDWSRLWICGIPPAES